jgi:KDO2-lipid IV(A) lauroyltransferase
MNVKKTAVYPKMVLDRAGYLLGISMVYIIIWSVTLMGYRKALAVGEKIGDALYFLFSRMKAKVLHNLKFAFGEEISQKDRDETARKVLKNFGKDWVELFFAAGPSKNVLGEQIIIEGKENLDKALSQDRGVIAVSAHIGNYPLIGTKLAKEGYNFMMVIRDLKTRAGSAVYKKARELIELPSIATVPEKQFFKSALNLLKDNGILCLISDENKRYGGIFVDFFGHPASTAPGPAALTVRTGAPVVPVFIMRNDDNSQRIIIEKEIEWEQTGDTTRDMKEITSRFTKVIEDYVRMDPSQWVWTNWRWRTQPWGKSNKAKIKKKKRLEALKKILRKIGQ